LREHMAPEAVLMTDGLQAYREVGPTFSEHHRVLHERDEYAKTTANGRRAHVNGAEGFFGQMKRSLDGTHHHVSREHLHRYLAEHDYRWSTRKMNDTVRMQHLIDQVAGRRLAYRPLIGQ
jgi:ISXO2-like transposase domain